MVPRTPPTYSVFFILNPTLCWMGERAGGEQKIIMFRETPAHFFQANSVKGEPLPKFI